MRAVRRVARRDVVDAFCGRGVVMLRGFGSGLLIRKPRRAVVRVGFGFV